MIEQAQHRLSHSTTFIEEENLNEPEKMEEILLRHFADTKETTAILVEGLNAKTDQEMVELFFENTKRSGGGEITDIQMNQALGSAVIWFAESAVEKQTQIY